MSAYVVVRTEREDNLRMHISTFESAIEKVELAIQKLGKDRVIVATSSSLLHVPHTLESEKHLDAEVRDWFSFAVEKASEVVVIAKAETATSRL